VPSVIAFLQLHKKKMVTISGTLVHFSNQVEVQDMSEFQYLLPPTAERMIIPEDSSGKFNISFPLNEPNYFRIGRNILYLTPGDKLQAVIDYNNPLVATFKGRGAEVNIFLRATPFPKAGSYLEAGSKAQPTPQQTIDFIIAAGERRRKQLDSLQINAGIKISSRFMALEFDRIRADIVNSLLDGQVPFYRPRAIQKDSVKMKQYGDEYAELIKPAIDLYASAFTDANALKLAVFRDIIDELVKQPGFDHDIQQMKDWIKASAIIERMKTVSDKAQLQNIKPEVDSIKTIAYRNAVNTSLEALLKFGKGDKAIDFTATDINGNAINLSSLKGKVIYIDLWATWCGPCMQEMPHYETLKEKYAADPNIAFISLSIDDNNSLWKSSVANRKAGGYQWLINRNKLNDYNIVSIPRTLLIDKDFKMVDMNAPVPSSKKLIVVIDALLNK
jgi:thiol-disulfide isomerase/thioredoxin